MLQEIKKDIFSVGAPDHSRKIFDALIPLKMGTSYNSYLIKGSEKNALIDTVDPTKTDILLTNLEKAGIKKIDYLIINHAEQDHSGSIQAIIKKFPEIMVVCSEKCKSLLIDLLGLDQEKIKTVADQEKITLGNKTLEFIYLPWVHWPETMATYLLEEKILFSCDFFGSHLAQENLLDFAQETVEKMAKIYFAEIMMPFRKIIKNNLAKLENYELKIIAPSHGPVYLQPSFVINKYQEWISDQVKNKVIVIYVSMHDSTKIMVENLVEELKKKNIEVIFYDAANFDLSELAFHLVDAATIIVGSPCVLGNVHPVMANLIYLTNLLKPKTKFISILGSYSWGCALTDSIANMIKGLNVEILPPVIAKGLPKKNDLEKIKKLADLIKEKHQTII